MSLTERDARIAYDAGRRARRAGKPKHAAPKYDNTQRGEAQLEQFEKGWDDENRDRLALAQANVRVPA